MIDTTQQRQRERLRLRRENVGQMSLRGAKISASLPCQSNTDLRHGHWLLISTGKFNVFVLTKQNVVHYSYAEQGYGMVSLSSSYDEEKRIFNQHHYGTAYEIDLSHRELLITKPIIPDRMQTCIVFEICGWSTNSFRSCQRWAIYLIARFDSSLSWGIP